MFLVAGAISLFRSSRSASAGMDLSKKDVDKLGLSKCGIHLPQRVDTKRENKERRVEPVGLKDDPNKNRREKSQKDGRERSSRSPSKDRTYGRSGSSIASQSNVSMSRKPSPSKVGGADSVVSGLTSHSRYTTSHRTLASVASATYRDSGMPSSERKRNGDPRWNMYDRTEGPSIFFDDAASMASYSAYGRHGRAGIFISSRYLRMLLFTIYCATDFSIGNYSPAGLGGSPWSPAGQSISSPVWQSSPLDHPAARSMRSPALNAELQYVEALEYLDIESIPDGINDELLHALAKHVGKAIRDFDKSVRVIVTYLKGNETTQSKLSFRLSPKNISLIEKLLSLQEEKVTIEDDHGGNETTLRDLIDEFSDSGLFSEGVQQATPVAAGGFGGFGGGFGGFGGGFGAPAAAPPGQFVNNKAMLVEYEAILEAFLMPSSISNSASVLHNRSKHRKKWKSVRNFSDEELSIAVAVRARMDELASDGYLGKFRYSVSPEKRDFRTPMSLCPISDTEIVLGLFLYICNKLNHTSGHMHFSDNYYAEDVNHASKLLREALKEPSEDKMYMPCITRINSSPPQFSILLAEKDFREHDVVVTEHKIFPGRQNCFHAIIIFLVYLGVVANVEEISAPMVIRDFYKEVFGINNTRIVVDILRQELVKKELLGPEWLSTKSLPKNK